MISKTFLIIFIFIFSSTFLVAQNEITITGKVLEDSSFAPLPFSTIVFENSKTGVVADGAGNFKLLLDTLRDKKSCLLFSSVGYESKIVSVDSLLSQLNNTVLLKPKAYQIPEVRIPGMSAMQIVKKMIAEIPRSFAGDTFYSKVFYRQYHKENNFYVRLIETSLVIENKIAETTNFLAGTERVQVTQLRRSNNYEMNNEEHGDHLFDLLLENPVYHPSGTVLNRKGLSFFKFFPDTNENDSVYHIFYFSKATADEKLQKGELFIDKKTFALIKFTKEEEKNDRAFIRYAEVKSVPYHWEFQNGKVIAEYKCHEGKMFLASLNKTYTHELYNNKVNSKDFVVTENFELKVDSNFNSAKNLTGNFSAVSNLYHSHYSYDKFFWDNYSLPPFVFTSSKRIIADLERKETLEEQFAGNRETSEWNH